MDNQHYVKFLRGTPEAWSRLTTKDPDTLYFVCEKTGTTGNFILEKN